MTFNTALAEQILANLPKAPKVSRPRCMCHNRYLQDCPTTTPRDADLKQQVSDQLSSLDNRHHRGLVPVSSKCKKHGHKSRGKAEAQLRSILKNQDFRPDKKDLSNIEVYKCRRVECKEHPWHVGHNPYVRRES